MDFYERVKELVKSSTELYLKDFIESLGISYETYLGQKRHDNLPRADDAMKIAAGLHTSVEYLVSGEGNVSTVDDRFFVPVLNQKLSAGHGQMVLDDSGIRSYMEVPRYLRHYGENLVMLYVEGDSMEPTLRKGDLVLCDSCGYDGEGLYAVQYDGDAYVKRVFKMGGKFIIKSDNPLYPQMEEPIGSDAIAIVGRVRYTVKKCD